MFGTVDKKTHLGYVLDLDVWVRLLDFSALLAHEEEVGGHRALGSVGVLDLLNLLGLTVGSVFPGWHGGVGSNLGSEREQKD